MCGPLANYNNNIFIFLSKIVYIKRALKKFTVIDAFYDAMRFLRCIFAPLVIKFIMRRRDSYFSSCLLVLFALYFYKLFTRWPDAARYTHTRSTTAKDIRFRRVSRVREHEKKCKKE